MEKFSTIQPGDFFLCEDVLYIKIGHHATVIREHINRPRITKGRLCSFYDDTLVSSCSIKWKGTLAIQS
jgi:hypothetical protein